MTPSTLDRRNFRVDLSELRGLLTLLLGGGIIWTIDSYLLRGPEYERPQKGKLSTSMFYGLLGVLITLAVIVAIQAGHALIDTPSVEIVSQITQPYALNTPEMNTSFRFSY
jgi:hypothetical protein